MSRYVDIDTINPKQYENSEVEFGVLAYDYDEIDAMPFLDIVTCKECKYWQDQEEGVVEVPICARPENKREPFPMVMVIGGDGFCSYGEREDE